MKRFATVLSSLSPSADYGRRDVLSDRIVIIHHLIYLKYDFHKPLTNS